MSDEQSREDGRRPASGRGDRISDESLPVMPVAVGVVRGPDGRILTARRRPGTPGAGQWEFPGGKVEQGETVIRALQRELEEEVGIRVTASRPLICVRYAFPDRVVVLETHEVFGYEGEPHGREGQELAWVPGEDLSCPPILASSVAIVAAIQLPDTYLFTGGEAHLAEVFLDRLKASISAGARLIRLRCPELEDARYRHLASRAIALAHESGAELLLDREPGLVEALGADGFHLSARELMQLDTRPRAAGRWLGASCHSAEELRRAERIGCDFAVLSPVAPTASHPQAEPLGWAAFSELVRGAQLPVYALGGMRREDVEIAHRNGGQGIAGISGLWVG